MVTHSTAQSSTPTLFTLLAMIAHSAVQSSTRTLFTLLAVIDHSAVQPSERTLFTMLSCLKISQQSLVQQRSFSDWEVIFEYNF